MSRPQLAERNRTIRNGSFLYEDAAWMRSAYQDRHLSLRQMATEASCGLRTIARWMNVHGIGTRDVKTAISASRKTGPESPLWKGVRVCPKCGGRKEGSASYCMSCRDYKNDRHPHWSGDSVGYAGAHDRVKSIHGSASGHGCENCTHQAESWSYQHTDPNEKFEPGEGWYSPDPSHYRPLCNPCHWEFDRLTRPRGSHLLRPMAA